MLMNTGLVGLLGLAAVPLLGSLFSQSPQPLAVAPLACDCACPCPVGGEAPLEREADWSPPSLPAIADPSGWGLVSLVVAALVGGWVAREAPRACGRRAPFLVRVPSDSRTRRPHSDYRVALENDEW